MTVDLLQLFLDEHSHTREMFHYLHFDIPPWLSSPSEHRRTVDNDHTWFLAWGHVLDKVIQGFEDAGVLTCRDDRDRGAFYLKDRLRRLIAPGLIVAITLRRGPSLLEWGMCHANGHFGGVGFTIRDGGYCSIDLHRILDYTYTEFISARW